MHVRVFTYICMAGHWEGAFSNDIWATQIVCIVPLLFFLLLLIILFGDVSEDTKEISMSLAPFKLHIARTVLKISEATEQHNIIYCLSPNI